MAETSIEWTRGDDGSAGLTWNPTTGCDRISPGCDNCYALSMAKRLKAMGQAKYQNDGDPPTSGPGFGITVHPGNLTDPFGWSGSRKVFVNSMSDLFHARVPLDFVRQVFEVIEATPQHTYQALTKRASRLPRVADKLSWPANLWMGVSVESADELDRVDDLRHLPAAVRFLSLEPLLGPLPSLDLAGIGWVIAGGESGPGARPMHPDWVRSIRDRCVAAGVPFFFKQWGAWIPESLGAHVITERSAKSARYADLAGGHRPANIGARNGAATCHRVGKKVAGRELDGRTWDEYPQPVEVSRAS